MVDRSDEVGPPPKGGNAICHVGSQSARANNRGGKRAKLSEKGGSPANAERLLRHGIGIAQGIGSDVLGHAVRLAPQLEQRVRCSCRKECPRGAVRSNARGAGAGVDVAGSRRCATSVGAAEEKVEKVR